MNFLFQKYLLLTAVLGFLLCSANLTAQYDIPEKPSLETSVYDYIGLLSPSQKSALENKLIRYADSTSTQIVCVIISNTKGEDISFLGAKWGQEWGIGQKGKDNGILITLAKDDRRVDINTGYGIEYRITDRMAHQIINRIMIPEFKQENYYAGLDKGSDAIFAALKGEFKEDRKFKNDEERFPILPVILIFIIIIALINKGNKGGRGGKQKNNFGGTLLDFLILSSMGRTGGSGRSFGGGFGGGSGSGGGFGGGFGGGGFGGGGASGGW